MKKSQVFNRILLAALTVACAKTCEAATPASGQPASASAQSQKLTSMPSSPTARQSKFTTLAGSVLSGAVAGLGTVASDSSIKVNPLPVPEPNRSAAIIQAPAAASKEPQLRLLESALRTAIAREETLRLMTPSQRDAFKRLQDQVGGAVEIRLRPGAGTPRVIALPKTVRSAKPAVVVVADPFATAYAFLATNRDLLLLADPEQELRVARQETDDLHLTHVRFSQMYQGLNVWPAELIVHLNLDREVNLLNGAFVPTPKEVPTTPTVDSDGAVAAARTAAPGGADAKSGAPTLMIYAPGDKPARLAWKVELDIAADSRWLVVIDALDGSTLNAFNQVMEENAVGSGVDLLNATRPMNVWHGNNQYYLVDTSKPMFDPASTPPANPKGAIVIVDANHQTLPSNGDMTCDQITSSSPTSGWMQDGVSAAFGLSQTYDYYQTRHNRNSIDGQGGTMTGIVRYSQNFKNAFWNGQAMFFGDALPYAAALDTVAHELTHGVTGHTANLLYQDQSGAMNEAFSDIFGEMVEAFVKGTNDWQLGEDMNHIMRCMSDPSSLEIMPGHPFPSKMSEYLGPDDPVLDNFQNRDSGGVHINSLIISHAYFLLAAGMEGALPPTKAASIFYRALTTHLVSQSQFLDGRIACIQAAKELFGDASAEATKTEQAFDGVEIFDGAGQPPPAPAPTVNGADSVLFVYYDNTDGNVYLARREDGQGDPTYGVPLSDYAVKPSRPAVSGNGAVGVFVSGLFDMGIIPTDGSAVETTLGYPGQIASVGMAPDGKHYAFVLQDPATGQRQNRITYFDTTGTGSTRTITLTASSDAGPVNAIYYADTLCFTPDNRYIVYDALNLIRVNGGTSNQVWSIYAYDLQQDRTLTIVNPAPGMDIGNPSVGRTDGALIVFEARSQQTGVSKVIAANLRTGAKAEVGSVTQVLAWPCYNGDDSAIVYSQGNSSVPTGSSLVRQPLGSDHVTPTGQVVKWVAEGACGFVYRRGTYTAPAAQKNADLIVSVVSTPDPVPLGNNITFNVTVSNSGPDDATGVILLDTLPANTAFVSGAVSQGNASNSNGKVTCAFGNLAKGSTASATIVVSATAQGPALDGANVVADQADSNPANNTASVTVNVGTGPSSALLVVQVSPANGGTASGGGTFPVGSQQQISATPNPGWAFSQWQDGNTQNPRTVTIVAGGYKYTANFTNATASSIIPFSNSAAITINDNAPASPYPSTITVAGHSGPIQSATVTLHGLTHTWPHDVGALLVSPGGQKIVLLADAGGGNAIANVELTFDDSTAAGLTENDAITSGTHKPSSCGTGDTFPSPAPSSPYGTNLRALNGTDPNGVWSLFVLDDQAGESGSLAGGWTLALGLPGATPPSGTPVLSVPGFLANNQFQFTLSGATGSNYEIRVSSDLTHWRVFKTVFLTGTSINITDSSVGLTRRFYSARLAP